MPPNSGNIKRGSTLFVYKGVQTYFSYYSPSHQAKRNVVKVHQETGRKEPNIYVSQLCGGSDCTPKPVIACNMTQNNNYCCVVADIQGSCNNSYNTQVHPSGSKQYYASCNYTTWLGDRLYISGPSNTCCDYNNDTC